MTQNIYDNDTFFTGYSLLPRSVQGLEGAPEWPVLRAMLPDLTGARVLDLGCGFGWFCRWAREAGAATVHGLDVSAKMLARAKAETNDPAITYDRGDLETVELSHGAFDLVYSSLAFHYLEHLDRLIREIAAALVPGGKLVFSVEHPICTAPSRPEWRTDAEGRKIWPLERYLDEGPRVTDWLAPGVIKQHRGMATYFNLLLDAGFRLRRIEEWSPSKVQIAAEPGWADERHRPFFLLVVCERGN